MPYQPGDENIVSDSVTHQIHYLNCTPAHSVNGISENNLENNFSFYPNPSKETFVISMSEIPIAKTTLTITNLLGEKVKEKLLSDKTTEIKLEQPDGIYFLNVGNAKGKFATKLIIQH